MSARHRLRQIRELELLQRVERDVAGTDVAEARARETEARAAAERDAERAGVIAEQWYAGLASTHFQPELHRAIGTALVGAVEVAAEGERKAESATQMREVRTDQWRLSDARVRATARIVGDLTQRQAQRDEETALGEAAARIALNWSRE